MNLAQQAADLSRRFALTRREALSLIALFVVLVVGWCVYQLRHSVSVAAPEAITKHEKTATATAPLTTNN